MKFLFLNLTLYQRDAHLLDERSAVLVVLLSFCMRSVGGEALTMTHAHPQASTGSGAWWLLHSAPLEVSTMPDALTSPSTPHANVISCTPESDESSSIIILKMQGLCPF